MSKVQHFFQARKEAEALKEIIRQNRFSFLINKEGDIILDVDKVHRHNFAILLSKSLQLINEELFRAMFQVLEETIEKKRLKAVEEVKLETGSPALTGQTI